MKRTLVHVGVIAALAATLVTGQSAAAAGPKAVRTTTASKHVRILAPRLPQSVASRIAASRQLARAAVISPSAPLSPVPLLPQLSSRNRTTAGSVAAITPPAPAPTPNPTPTPSTDNYHVSAQQVLINQDRATNGALAPLAWSPCLASIAVQNAQRIAAQGYLSHTNGPTLDLGCDPGYTTAGENIAYISSGIDDSQANTMFMNSAPHRANILNGGYRYVGTAWVVAPNGYGYIAVEFAG